MAWRIDMKSERVTRIVKILTALQSGKGFSAGHLSSLLGASRRTIFRDLKELQAIGVPYHYDRGSGSYRIEPDFFLPPIDLNLQEALSLLLAGHKALHQMQFPFRNKALLAILKVENNLPPQIRRYCNTALRDISMRMEGQAPTRLLDRFFGQLQKAISNKRKVKMKYHSLFEGGDIELCLCPYHLMFNRRAWYVLGYSSIHSSVRTFKVNRIQALETLDKCFLRDEEFELTEYFGRAWSMIPAGRIYQVKLRFFSKVAENVAEVHWHSTQKVSRQEDGSAIMEFRVDGLDEIIWWILGYGDQVEVLSPRALRKKVGQTAERMVELSR